MTDISNTPATPAPSMSIAGYPIPTSTVVPDVPHTVPERFAVPTIVTPAETAAIAQIGAAVSSIIPAKVRAILYPVTGLVSVAALALATSGQLHGVYETVTVIVGSVAAPFGSALALSHIPAKSA